MGLWALSRGQARYHFEMAEAVSAGLCDRCRWQRLVPGLHTVFSLCVRGLSDPSFRKYPPLPVRQCPGFESRRAADEPDGASGPETVS